MGGGCRRSGAARQSRRGSALPTSCLAPMSWGSLGSRRDLCREPGGGRCLGAPPPPCTSRATARCKISKKQPAAEPGKEHDVPRRIATNPDAI